MFFMDTVTQFHSFRALDTMGFQTATQVPSLGRCSVAGAFEVAHDQSVHPGVEPLDAVDE